MHFNNPFTYLLFLCLFPFSTQATIPATERDALLALYNDTNGAGWTDYSNWTVGDPCDDSWHGISCSSNITVTQINLERNNLSGSLPLQLGNLPNLTHLDLYSNKLIGNIPVQLSNLSKLEYLHLGQNQLTGNLPKELSQLTRLRFLTMQRNQLTGNIPKELGTLLNLVSLRLDSSQLVGSIPKELGNLHELRMLALGSNQLTGIIPKELGNLRQLKTFDLARNHLEGSIPEELSNLKQLQYLQLAENQLIGRIPDNLINLTNSLGIGLAYNALHTNNTGLDSFLDSKQQPSGDWSITQTVAPTNVTLDAFTTDSASLQWDLIEYTQNNGSYQIYSSTNGAPYIYDHDATTDKNTDGYTFTGLSTTGNNYCFVVRTVTEPSGLYWNNRLESNASNQVCIINGEIDADGDGLGDDTEDRDACYTVSPPPLSADEYQGIGNTTLSSGGTISTENTGTIKTLAPHQLILKADSVAILTGMIFSVAVGAEFTISSEPDSCP